MKIVFNYVGASFAPPLPKIQDVEFKISKKEVSKDEHLCLHCNRLRHKSFLRPCYGTSWRCIMPCWHYDTQGKKTITWKYFGKIPKGFVNPYVSTCRALRSCVACGKRRFIKSMDRVGTNLYHCKKCPK